VRCLAILKSGRPCRNNARSPDDLCVLHAGARERDGFYGKNLSPDAQQALAAAGQLEGVDSEIAVLRVLIRQVFTLGDVEEARRSIDTLCRTLRAGHALDDRSAQQLQTSLDRVLDTLGEDLGISL